MNRSIASGSAMPKLNPNANGLIRNRLRSAPRRLADSSRDRTRGLHALSVSSAAKRGSKTFSLVGSINSVAPRRPCLPPSLRGRTSGHLFRLAGHGVYGHARRVVARQPDEGAAPHADMSETREGDMRGADPVSCLRRIGKYALAVHFGLVLVAVVFDGHGGIRKLDSRDVNYISPDEQLLSPALDRV